MPSVRAGAFSLPSFTDRLIRSTVRSSISKLTWIGWLLTMVALTLLVVGVWGVRNHAVLGRWVWLTTNGGVTKYDGFNPDATGASDQGFLRSLEMRGLRSTRLK